MSITSLVNTRFILAVLALNFRTHNPYKDSDKYALYSGLDWKL